MTTFQLAGIEAEQFEPLFELSDAELSRQSIVRRISDSATGFPCRVSLEDAAVGDELLLLHYSHHSVDAPYRASGPIYVRRGQTKTTLAPGLVPDYVTRRIISMRAYSSEHMMVLADVLEGSDVARGVGKLFIDSAVSYVQLHAAKQGCFLCHVKRA